MVAIPDTPRFAISTAIAGQTAFPFTWVILDAADLVVKRWRAGAETPLTYGVHFTLSGVGEPAGGTVTLTDGALAGDIIARYSRESGERVSQYVAETLTKDDLNGDFNRVAQALLDLRRDLDRRIGILDTDAASVPLTLPFAADRANALLGFSSTGAPEVRLSSGTVILVLGTAGPPAANAGATGDLALGTDGSVWSKASGAWLITTTNIKGATGPSGSVGTLPDGTPAAPGLAFGADTNTGLHRVAADLMALVANGIIQVQVGTTGLEILGASSFLTMPEHGSAPATPAAGKVALYAKSTGRVYAKDASGREFMLNDSDPGIADFRLTLTSGTPVMTVDTTGTTLYMTPYRGNRLALWNTTESIWEVFAFAEQSIALSGLTAGRNYDVFGYLNAGAFTFDLVAWTNDTTRATAIAYQDGVPVKTGALERRLIGSFRALSATQIEWKLGGTGAGGVAASLGLWHANPKVREPVRGMVRDSTDSWTYAVTAWRAANNSTSMRVSVLDGDGGLQAESKYGAIGQPPAANYASCGIGLDSAAALAAGATATAVGTNGIQHGGTALFSGGVGLGWHFLQALECRLQGAGSITFYGDAGLAFFQSGFAYEVMA